MLIDWLSLFVPFDALSPETVSAVVLLGDRLQRYCPQTGEVKLDTPAWQSVRSDSHQLALKVGAHGLYVNGSPARCMGDGCAVFGSPGAMDVRACALAMIALAGRSLGQALPVDLTVWKVTRMDITGNLALQDLPEVRQALAYLRGTEGGRYRVSQTAGDTVYWSSRSQLRAGKAYAKGPHMQYLARKRADYTGRAYSDEELYALARVLRLELSLKAQWWRERAPCPWHEMSEAALTAQWAEYFGRMVGAVEMTDENEMLTRVLEVAPTEGQGRAAYAMWCMIKAQGWQWTRDNTSRPTYYRNAAILRAAGLGDSDLSSGQVIPLRRRALVLEPVRSFAALLAA
jgi:hypothetical protein